MALVGDDVTVELLLDAAWVDVTEYVQQEPGLSISFGVRGETGTADPATCTLLVNNRDGRFTPKNPTGPYYGLLKRNTPLRASVDGVVRFVGEVSEFPPEWDPTGNNVTTSLTAAGPLRRLLRGRALPGALRSQVQKIALTRAITGYWPMEDGPGSTSFASGLPGGSPMTFTGSPDMGGYTPSLDYAGSENVAMFNAGDTAFAQAAPATGTGFTAGVLIGFPTASLPDETELFRVWSDGTAALWTVKYDLFSTGALRVQAFTYPGGVQTEVLNNTTSFGLDGLTRYVKLEVQDDGANIDWSLSVFGTGSTGGQVNSVQVGPATRIQLNPTATLDGVGYGHVVLGSSHDAIFTTAFDDGLDAFTAETIEARMARLAGVAGVGMTVLTNTTGGVEASTVLGPQPADTPLGAMRDAEAADVGGILRDALNTVNALVYMTRRGRYNDEPALTLDYAAGHLTPPMSPTDDDALLANDVTVTRTNGSAARAVDEDGPLSALDYPDGVGTYGLAPTVNVSTDTVLPWVANWLLSLGTLDKTRFPEITVDVVKNPGLLAAVDALRPGNLIELVNLPGFVSTEAVRLHVLGWAESITGARRLFTFNCAPADVYDVVRLDDDQYGRLDSSATVTAEALDTTETGVDYTGGVWVDTATHAEDFPFDVEVGGEVMTVTSAVVGTFTVTRSVNGVVKAHDSGAALRLHRPNRIAL